MAMKPLDAPRRLYSRKGRPFVNHGGCFWGPKTESAMETAVPVTCVANEVAANGQESITVTQRKPKRKGIKETWYPVFIGS